MKTDAAKQESQLVGHTCQQAVPTSIAEADLIEELARLHGYDNIPTTLPHLRSAGAKIDVQLSWERSLRRYFAGEGFSEVINLPFTTENLNNLFTGVWQSPQVGVAVLNPLAKDNAEMRHSLLPGLIDNLRLNLAHKARSFSAFHLGKVFSLAADGAVTNGNPSPESYMGRGRVRFASRRRGADRISWLQRAGGSNSGSVSSGGSASLVMQRMSNFCTPADRRYLRRRH